MHPYKKGADGIRLDYRLNRRHCKPAIDEKIILTAQERNYPLVRLGHLGDIDRMMALGKFEHKGVSIHPNDNGMEAIADAIYGVLCHLI